MNIAIVSHLAYPPFVGGVEKYVYYTAKELSRLGHNVDIYTTDPTGNYCGEKEIDGIRFHRFYSIAPKGIYYFSEHLLRRLLKLRNFDIVHANAYGTFAVLASSLAKKINNIPTIVQTHLAAPRTKRVLHQLYGPTFGAYILNTCDNIILVSPAEYLFLSILRKYTEKITWIPNGVDLEKVNAYYQFTRSRFDANTFHLLCVARLEKMKGIENAIYLIHDFKEECPVLLTVVGEGPYRHYLEELTDKLGLKKKVQFLGKISERKLYQIYAKTHVFLSLSEYESHSLSLLEAMAFGVVPIATKVGGNILTIDDGQNGILIPFPLIRSRLKWALKELVNDAPRLSKMSMNARNKVMQKYNLKKSTSRLVELYEQCVNT